MTTLIENLKLDHWLFSTADFRFTWTLVSTFPSSHTFIKPPTIEATYKL
jgi:hypothetical protein